MKKYTSINSDTIDKKKLEKLSTTAEVAHKLNEENRWKKILGIIYLLILLFCILLNSVAFATMKADSSSYKINSKTIVFITGALGNRSIEMDFDINRYLGH